jgi:1,4-dihydroxy-2-naphthoate polyprenyltransferase
LFQDFKKGADTHSFLGPTPVLVSGWLTPAEVKQGIYTVLALSLLLALPLIWVGGAGVLALGLVGLIGAYWYTAGPFSLAYLGLGDIAVFLLFGPLSVCGTLLVQLHAVAGGGFGEGWWSVVPHGFRESAVPAVTVVFGVAAGLYVNAILVVNNIRDIETDRKVNKNTTATRLGAPATRVLYSCCLLGPYAIATWGVGITGFLPKGFAACFITMPVALLVLVKMYRVGSGKGLNACLEQTTLCGALFFASGLIGLHSI